MRFIYPFLSLSLVLPLIAHSSEHTSNDQPTAKLLEFLAEFNLLDEDSDRDYDLIQFHALHDLKKQTKQERK